MRFWHIVVFVFGFLAASIYGFLHLGKDEIKIGLLYSKTGPLAQNEISIANALKLGAKQINKNGGIGGKEVKILEYDGASNPLEFAKGAQSLIDSGAKALFGCWTSASRKAVKTVVEKNKNILFYPVQFEGFESSPNIVYLGLTPNQQINPIINYAMNNFGKNVFLVGSDYVYPKMANLYIKEFAKITGLKIVGEKYKDLECKDFSATVEQIKNSGADFVINTLNGSSNALFFEELKRQNFRLDKMPIFSTSIDHSNLEQFHDSVSKEFLENHFITCSFDEEDLKNEEIGKIIKKYGSDEHITDVFAATFYALKLYKQAIEEANSEDPTEVLKTIARQSVQISQDKFIKIDPQTLYSWLFVNIVKTDKSAKLQKAWGSQFPIEPKIYPSFRTKSFWEGALKGEILREKEFEEKGATK